MEFFYALKKGSELQLSSEPLVDVIAIGEEQQRNQDHKPCDLSVLEEFVAGLSTADDLIEGEYHMTSI